MTIVSKMKNRKEQLLNEHGPFRNEDGAIDLASIMVGIIVIGLIGGVIAATVFGVIPWTQDNAAKQQLDSVVSAQSAYKGLASSVPPAIPAGHTPNSYASSAQLEEAKLMARGLTHCTVATDAGNGYAAFTKSAAGKIWTATDKKTKPVLFTGTLPTDCAFIGSDAPSGTPTDIDGDGIPNTTDTDMDGDGTPNTADTDIDNDGTPNAQDFAPEDATVQVYADPTPKLTKLTFRCDTATAGVIPMKDTLTGTETWSDGVTKTYTNAAAGTGRTLDAGVTYTVTFDGTYKTFTLLGNSSDLWKNCLRSVDHWGAETGVTAAYGAFYNSITVIDVPQNIPTTITNMNYMMFGSKLNDPDVGKWNVSNVTQMNQMFKANTVFNQPLNDWNVSNVKDMSDMFYHSFAFNQPLNNWNVSNVTTMKYMFYYANNFNQPLNNWRPSNVTDMSYMFMLATKFNGSVEGWDTSKVTTMAHMFEDNTGFNSSLNSWNTAALTSVDSMFFRATAYNQPMNNWNTSNLTNMSMFLMGANAFNQNINNWDTSKVTNMVRVFASARGFNQPLDNWNTSSAIYMDQMFHNAISFNQPIGNWNTSNVTSMFQMFYINTAFDQYIKDWNVAKVTNSSEFRYGARLQAINSPF